MVRTRSQQIQTLKKDDTKLVLQLKGGPGRRSSTTRPSDTRPTSLRKRSEGRSKPPTKSGFPIRKANSKRPFRKSSARHDRRCASKQGTCPAQVPSGKSGPAKKFRGTSAESGAQISAGDSAECNSFPSRGWGQRETVGLSKIDRADKEIEIWEEVLRNHEINYPQLVPVVKESLMKARRLRAALDETLEENLRVG